MIVLVAESWADKSQGRVADISRPTSDLHKEFVGGVIAPFAYGMGGAYHGGGPRDVSMEVVQLDVTEPVVPFNLVDVTKDEIDMIADEETTSPPPSPKPESTPAGNSSATNSTASNNSTKAEDCDDTPKSAGAAQKDKDDAVNNAATAMGIKRIPGNSTANKTKLAKRAKAKLKGALSAMTGMNETDDMQNNTQKTGSNSTRTNSTGADEDDDSLNFDGTSGAPGKNSTSNTTKSGNATKLGNSTKQQEAAAARDSVKKQQQQQGAMKALGLKPNDLKNSTKMKKPCNKTKTNATKTNATNAQANSKAADDEDGTSDMPTSLISSYQQMTGDNGKKKSTPNA